MQAQSAIGNPTIHQGASDYKAELIAALLLEQGLSMDQLLIIRDGAGKRGVAKDIASVEYGRYKNTDTSLVIHTRRRGLYDQLPEGLFHRTTPSPGQRSKERILADMNRQRAEEFFIRNYFRLFETEADAHRVLSQQLELHYDRKNEYPEYVSVFKQYWPILKEMEISKAVLFMKLIPVLPEIRLSRSGMAKAIEIILDIPVHIRKSSHAKNKSLSRLPKKLGQGVLGRDFVLDGTSPLLINDLNIEIGPIPPEKLPSFLPDAPIHNILTLLLNNLLPASSQPKIHFITSPHQNPFTLHKTGAGRNFLGRNTWLS